MLPAMRKLNLTAALILSLPSLVHAQTTESDLRARLVSKPLYLRGSWRDDSLSFDPSGHLIGTSKLISWTLSGVRVTSIQRMSDRLILSGNRVGVKFVSGVPQRVDLKVAGAILLSEGSEEIKIQIQSPASGDYTQPLNVIFVDGLADLVPLMPRYWKDFANRHLLPSGAVPNDKATSTSDRADAPPPATSGTPVVKKAPVLVKQFEPQFSNAARALKYAGSSLVQIEVDEKGKPDHLKVLEPLGLGLDEQALAAAAQFEFEPALWDGVPVRADVDISVTFHLIITKI